ncbi:hypothetical protein E2562_036118 [Oryza meyeriana var. granulata]|uniref:Telomerase activating protein Est1-like N-terminal domain-containing protein n=1 Tax=Oryza meyeriana var. granulata TaxID=110450 RepID=A0A6G1CLE8_9ORYZ|nr:hypothetical protein E2562_036118 [Oryza meyeriana var. granulata]
MRENYQKIILADHDFSEGHEIEHLLWKIHYKRIEEFRTHIISAGKNNINPDRTKRIRSTFRSFLSEATGFYHDLILKIRSTYGLPFGYFSEGSDSSAVSGDLTRYKGLYGDADYASCEYAAASIYYKEAALLCPNGNPHHQNHEVYGQLPGNNKIATARSLPSRSVGRGRGRGETKFQPKDTRTEETSKGKDRIAENLLGVCQVFQAMKGVSDDHN